VNKILPNGLKEAANEVTNSLICGVSVRGYGGRLHAPIARVNDAHTILHLLRNPIIAHHRSWVAQAAAFPLDDKTPKRVAGVRNQRPTPLVSVSPVAVVLF